MRRAPLLDGAKKSHKNFVSGRFGNYASGPRLRLSTIRGCAAHRQSRYTGRV
jgi:hypothetical protein